MLKTVEIEVRDGIALAMVIPDGVQVIIKDYDVQGINEAELLTDCDGHKYDLWSSPG